MQAADRYDVEVAVGYLEPRDGDSDPLRVEPFHLRPANRLRRLGEVGEERGIQIDPVIDLLPGHDQGVARPQRPVG